MVLNVKSIVLVCLALFSLTDAYAVNQNYYKVSKVTVRQVRKDVLNQEVVDSMYRKSINFEGLPVDGQPSELDKVGKVISIAKDLVALGEDIYKLVIKGKPSNTTTYAPISVVPKENGAAVDVMETENWKTPVKRSYEVLYENVYGMDVVKFRYSVIFAHGGTYNGKGAYLTAVQIIPESVSTMFGYDFTATMKLGGIQNNRTRENPLAGATLLLEYTVRTVMKASTEVSTVFIDGNGFFKHY